MTKRLCTPAGALVLAICALAGAAPASASPAARDSSAPPLAGVNINGPTALTTVAYADREIAQAHELGAKAVRVELPWTVLEPHGPGQLDSSALAFTDHVIGDAAADGIRVIAFVDVSPCWASSAPSSLLRRCQPNGTTGAHAWPPRDPADYASFLALLAQRYGTRLTAIEVWNEPDQANQRYFDGPSKPQRYAAILRAAYTAVKQVSPGTLILGGSLVGSNGVFLRALYAAGIKGFYDGLAVHFYTLTLAAVRAIHETQLANGDSKPLWLDEFGWPSCLPKKIQEEQACVTPQIQARNLGDIFRSLARAPYIAADVSYDLQDVPGQLFGAFDARGQRKSAFGALSQVFASPFGSPSAVTLKLARRGSSVLASGSGPVGDYMQLEVFAGATLRYKALFILDRFNRYALTLPSVLGTHGLRVRVYQYWMGAGHSAQKSV